MASSKNNVTFTFSGKDTGLGAEVNKVAGGFAKLGKSMDALFPKGKRNPFGTMTRNLQTINTNLQTVKGSTKTLVSAFSALTSGSGSKSFKTMATNAGSLNSAMQTATTTLQNFSTMLAGVKMHSGALTAAQTAAAKAVANTGKQSQTAQKHVQGLSVNLSRLGSMMKTGVVASFKMGTTAVQTFLRLLQSIGSGIGSVLGFVGRLTASFGNLAKRLGTATANMLGFNRSASTTRVNMRGLVGHVTSMTNEVIKFASGIRQIGQGFQNLGMTLSVFVSYPLQQILKDIYAVGVAFDDTMIEVRKNTGATTLEVAGLSREIQNMAAGLGGHLGTPTSPVDLGKIAADAARLGVPTEAIAGYTEILDQLVVATNFTAETAVDDISRIVAIFYDLNSIASDPGAFIDYMKRIGSAINELGQANPITETELVASAVRAAPVTKTMGLNVQETLGIAATVASASASAERAGTQIATMFSEISSTDIADLAGIFKITSDEMKNMLDNDPTSVLIGIASAASQIKSNSEAQNFIREISGMVGGKALGILSSTLGQLGFNMDLANSSFADGTSLADEFSRAMDGVQNQMGLLRNQFAVLGIALGEAFLPVITELVSYAIPVLRALILYFRSLDDNTKLWIVGIMALTAALGPLLFIIGSLMFSVGIMITGFAAFGAMLASLITLPFRIIGSLGALVGSFGGVGVAIMGLIVIIGSLSGAFGQVGVVISTFITNAAAWGYNLMASFASGILDAAIAVYNAVYSVLSGIAAMMQSFSPPKEGPLKNIDKWGANIATTYADAFADGDLTGVYTFLGYISEAIEGSIRGLSANAHEFLGEVGSIFDGIVTSVAGALGMDTEESAAWGNEAFAGLIEFVDALESGSADAGALFESLRSYLGPFADDFAKLIGLQSEYNAELKEQEAIQDELDNLDKKTNARVKAIGMNRSMSVSERIAAIRQAKTSAAVRHTELTDQKKVSEERSTSLSEQIDATKSLVDLLKRFMPSKGGNRSGIGDTASADREEVERLGKSLEEINERRIELGMNPIDEFGFVIPDALLDEETLATIKANREALGLEVEKTGPTVKGALDGVSKAWDVGTDGLTDTITASTQKVEEELGTFFSKVDAKTSKIKGIFDGLFGKPAEGMMHPLTEEDADPFSSFNFGERTGSDTDYAEGYIVGARWLARYTEFVDNLTDSWNTAADAGRAVAGALVLISFHAERAFQNLPKLGMSKDMTDTQKMLHGIGTAMGNIARTAVEVGAFFALLFTAGSGETILEKLTRNFQEFAAAIAVSFIFSGDGNALAQAQSFIEIFKGLISPLATLAGLTFENLEVVGEFIGKAAAGAMGLMTSAGAIGLIISSLLGASDSAIVDTLANLEKVMNPGILKDAINKALSLSGTSTVPLGQQIVDYVVKSLQGADFAEIGRKLSEHVNSALVGNIDPSTGERSGGIVGILEGANLPGIFNGIFDAISGFVEGLETADFAGRIGDIIGGILSEITPDRVSGITDAAGGLITGALGSDAASGAVNAASAIITGIVNSLASIFGDADFAPMLSGLATTILNGIVGLPWETAASGLGDLARAILGAIANAPWKDAAEAATDLVIALVQEITKPQTLVGAAEALLNLAQGIIDGIGASLDKLDTETLDAEIRGWATDLAQAFFDAFYNRMIELITGVDQSTPLTPGVEEEVTSNAEARNAWADSLTQPRVNEETGEVSQPWIGEGAGWLVKGVVNAVNAVERSAAIQVQTDVNEGTAGDDLIPGYVSDPNGSAAQQILDLAAQNDAEVVNNMRGGGGGGDIWGWFKGLFSGGGSDVAGMGAFAGQTHGGENLQADIDARVAERVGALQAPVTVTPAQDNLSGLVDALKAMPVMQGPKEMPAGWSQAAAPAEGGSTMPAPLATPEDGAAYGLSLATQFQLYMTTAATTFFAPLGQGLLSWVMQSVGITQAAMTLYGTLMQTGLGLFLSENYAAIYTPLSTTLAMWIVENTGVLLTHGMTIGTTIAEGITAILGEPSYFSSITDAFTGFVSSVVDGHPILEAAGELSGRIVNEISDSMMERWEDVKEAIEKLIERALAGASPAGGGDAPPANSVPPVGANRSGTGSWGGGLTMVGEDGAELVNLPMGSRVFDNWQSGNIINQGIDEMLSMRPSYDRLAMAGSSGDGTVLVPITIQGDLVIDNDKRMNEMSDQISRKIGRKIRGNW